MAGTREEEIDAGHGDAVRPWLRHMHGHDIKRLAAASKRRGTVFVLVTAYGAYAQNTINVAPKLPVRPPVGTDGSRSRRPECGCVPSRPVNVVIQVLLVPGSLSHGSCDVRGVACYLNMYGVCSSM